MQSSAMMPTFPWSKSKQSQPSTSYSSLKQEEHEASPGSDDGLISGDSAKLNRQLHLRKTFMVSLIFNGAFFIALVILYSGNFVHPRHKRLLESPVPQFPTEIRTFELDPLYLSLPTNESNLAWENLTGPNGRGFINLDPDNGFGYPDTKAGLSVFHQLHCLAALRHLMWDLVEGRVDTEKYLQMWPSDENAPTYNEAIHGPWHFAHCFDYLRQGVMCSADLSLEFLAKTPALSVVDGLKYPHECKNWDAIWKYAEKYA